MSTHPATQHVNCTLTTCPISTSYYYYQPSLPTNAIFLTLFTLALLTQLTTYLLTHLRRSNSLPFTLALALGSTLEILGYTGRILSHADLWSQRPFLLQIICLTIAPAFIAAGIYLSLERIVHAHAAAPPRYAPRTLTRAFVGCDVVSLVLQALGGGMASAAYHAGRPSTTGDRIMVAGLAWQVLTLAVFMGLGIDFAIRVRRAPAPAVADEKGRRSRFRVSAFIGATAGGTVCIFVRSVYRVAELSEGWEGHLIRQQWLFVGLEGVLVAIGVVVLTVAHAAFWIGDEAGKALADTEQEG